MEVSISLRKIHKNKKVFLHVGSIFLIILTGYIFLSNLLNNNSTADKLSEFGFEDISIEDLVLGLDSGEIYRPNLKASITGSTLKLANQETSEEIELDNNKFYLSFAPYINHTHPCSNHNLITCSSELVNEMFDVKIVNSKEEVIFNEIIQSMDNGFIGLWLPKNITGTLSVSYNGLSASANIETYSNSNTCLTSPLKLS